MCVSLSLCDLCSVFSCLCMCLNVVMFEWRYNMVVDIKML